LEDGPVRIPKRAAAATAFVTAVAAAAAVYLFAPAVREPAAGPDAAPVPATADAPHRPSAGRVYPFRRVVALVIGIDGYPHLAGPADLTCAERDARAVGDLLAE
jgi:hypothetical protein